MQDLTVLVINGTERFRQQVAAALDVWFAYDRFAGELEEAVVSINEHDDQYKVYTEADRQVYVAHNVAFWPNVEPDMQVKILATYIGHEAIHAYLRLRESKDWNTAKGEDCAMEYQNRMAAELGVPKVYVNEPVKTIPGAVIIEPMGRYAALFVLAAAAAGTVMIKRVARGHSFHPALSRR